MRETDSGVKKLLPSEVRDLEQRLADHYGEPVRPVSHYCNAFYAWQRALVEARDRGDFRERKGDERWDEVIAALATLMLPIRKSNLLARLIYLGEEVRQEKCSVHKGHWSGWAFDDDTCECQSGADVTGWLPPHHLTEGTGEQ